MLTDLYSFFVSTPGIYCELGLAFVSFAGITKVADRILR